MLVSGGKWLCELVIIKSITQPICLQACTNSFSYYKSDIHSIDLFKTKTTKKNLKNKWWILNLIHTTNLLKDAHSFRNKETGCVHEYVIQSFTQLICSTTPNHPIMKHHQLLWLCLDLEQQSKNNTLFFYWIVV